MIHRSATTDLMFCLGALDVPVRSRPGTYRTQRCAPHSMRCDAEPIRGAQWLCPVCPCPWTRPVDGSPEPSKHAQLVLRAIVHRGVVCRSPSNSDLIIEALERTGLVVGLRPTPAGTAYANGHDFWAVTQ